MKILVYTTKGIYPEGMFDDPVFKQAGVKVQFRNPRYIKVAESSDCGLMFIDGDDPWVVKNQDHIDNVERAYAEDYATEPLLNNIEDVIDLINEIKAKPLPNVAASTEDATGDPEIFSKLKDAFCELDFADETLFKKGGDPKIQVVKRVIASIGVEEAITPDQAIAVFHTIG